MLIQLLVILLVYGLFLFALVLVEHLAVRSADSLAEWMTWKRFALTAAIAAVLVASGVGIAFKIGWLKFGTPYDSPGFEENLPKTAKPTPKAGPAPTVKTKVSKETMDSADKAHKKQLKDFEKSR